MRWSLFSYFYWPFVYFVKHFFKYLLIFLLSIFVFLTGLSEFFFFFDIPDMNPWSDLCVGNNFLSLHGWLFSLLFDEQKLLISK